MKILYIIWATVISTNFALAHAQVGEAGDIICYSGAFREVLGSRLNPLIHCAIDGGDGNVYEFTGGTDVEGPARIGRNSKEDFVRRATEASSEVFIHTEDRDPLDTDEVLARALDAFVNQNFGSYHPLTNNCQHFATYCKYGEKISFQANQGRRAYHLLRTTVLAPRLSSERLSRLEFCAKMLVDGLFAICNR